MILRADARHIPLRDESVDSIVTDPPYELGFMGKKWDSSGVTYSVDVWREALRVLKPGGHLLAFGGSRTYHRMACAIEDAGFEIRDQIMWIYGSGFPKSLDVSKAIDKAAGAERRVIGDNPNDRKRRNNQLSDYGLQGGVGNGKHTDPATDAARQWDGWGTALKPAHEPIVVARKPLIGTVAENVLKHGTGALNIDGCRVEIDPSIDDPRLGGKGDWSSEKMAKNVYEGGYAGERVGSSPLGRWPANVIHDGSEEVLERFPTVSSGMPCGKKAGGKGNAFGYFEGGIPVTGFGDSGSAARFFYCAKESDRGHGNNHPTVKPIDLMRYLCRLITPPGGIVLDPFLGSGSTGKAALLEGFRFIGFDLDIKYLNIAKKRMTTTPAMAGLMS